MDRGHQTLASGQGVHDRQPARAPVQPVRRQFQPPLKSACVGVMRSVLPLQVQRPGLVGLAPAMPPPPACAARLYSAVRPSENRKGLVNSTEAEMSACPVSTYSQTPLVAVGGGSFSRPEAPPWYTKWPDRSVSDEENRTGAIPSIVTVIFPVRSTTMRTPAPPAMVIPAAVMLMLVVVQEPTRHTSR